MADRLQIVQTRIPTGAINGFRQLARAPVLETLVAPRFAEALRNWLTMVARAAAQDMGKRSGRSARELQASARVTGGTRNLSDIRGYYLVSSAIASNEYGADIFPTNARKLAIPLPDALRPDGSPKRIGPNSWRSLGSFIYKSQKTGQLYIAYRSPGGLKLLYVLVDHARITEKRWIRNAADRLQPALYLMFSTILKEQIELVYSTLLEYQTSKGWETIKPNNSPPRPSTWAGPLLPRYRGQR